MALDATVGGPAANSYLDVAAADLLNANRLGESADRWADASTEDKEKALIQASADIDAHVYPGVVWSSAQLLHFPRDVDVDGDDLPYIHGRIRQATYEQAIYLLHNIDLLEGAARRRARGLISFDDDDVSGSIVLDGKVGLLAPRAEGLLQNFIATTSGGRAGSVRMRSVLVHAAASTVDY